eukprot:6672403-Heterocapsa_arctica.AAC.1
MPELVAITDCRRLNPSSGQPSAVMWPLDCDLWVAVSPAQSESLQPSKVSLLLSPPWGRLSTMLT